MRAIRKLEEIQEIQFDMLSYLNNISKKNHIKLLLGGGTLLGAVRHQGFIPWDDDVDVMLMRKDYNKLIKLIKADKNSPYKIMTVWNTLTYPLPFAKLVDTRTWVDDKRGMRIKGMGIAADIFPIDALPASPMFERLITKFVIKQTLGVYDLHDKKELSKGEYCLRLLGIKIKNIFITFGSTMAPLKSARHVAVIIGSYKEKEIMNKEEMTRCVKVVFNGEKFLAPAGYKKYLTQHYGKEYMKLPPKTMRRPEHHMNAYWR